ncbi:MAG: hypothetical protein EOO24_27720, partial [Comamonadaceae bacterium]
TDAVNGSQLFATNEALGTVESSLGNAVFYNDASKTSITLNPGAPGSPAGTATTIDNLAPGELSPTSTQAVNGSQLNTTNDNVTNLGNTVNNIDLTGTKYFKANSTLPGAQANGTDSVAIGPNAVASGSNSVALGSGSVANGSTLGATAYLVGGSASAEVNVGNRRITGVAGGSQDTDAANVAQVRRVYESGVHYDSNPDNSINYQSITLGQPGAPTVIRNVAPGVGSTDAVNLSQLNQAVTQIGAAGNKWVTGNPTTYVTPSASGTNATAVGSGASSTGNNSVALGNGASDGGRNNVVSVGAANGGERQVINVTAGTQTTDAVNVGQLRPFAGALGGGTTINTDGSVTGPTYNLVTVGPQGTTSTNSYNNVGDALGGLSNSVVNLNTAVGGISSGKGIKYFHANSTQADSQATGDESTAMGPQATATGSGTVAAGDRASASGAGGIAVGRQSSAAGAASVAVGQGSQASQAGTVVVGANGKASGTEAVAVGNGANASAAGGVALGAGAVADRGGVSGQMEAISGTVVNSSRAAVSVGSTGNERQITNVAGGTQATDAVNLRQLQAAQAGTVRYDVQPDGSPDPRQITLGNGEAPNGTVLSNVAAGVGGSDAVNVNQLNAGLAGAAQYVDGKVGQLQANIDRVGKDANAGAAGAMAMANLPQAT